jgi:hypothetical protein
VTFRHDKDAGDQSVDFGAASRNRELAEFASCMLYTPSLRPEATDEVVVRATQRSGVSVASKEGVDARVFA